MAELRRVRLPLVVPFRSALGVDCERDVLVVRVQTDEGEGWGECVAPRQPHYSAEYVDSAHHVIVHHLLPRLFALDVCTAGRVGVALDGVKGHQMAKAALEMAVLDAELRAAGLSLARYLGGVREEVVGGVAVGMTGSLSELVDLVAGYVEQGYQRVKLKIAPGWDVEPVRAVRERFGEGLLLQVDGNGAYSRAEGRDLARLDPFELLLIEQPLADDDLFGSAELARALRTPICLDESITSARSAWQALELGACRVINIKAGRVGGYLEARRVHDVCAAAGVAVWCGGMLETGLGRAANLALASLPNFTLPSDISASDRYFSTDLTPPLVLRNGRLAVPEGPGIGVEIVADRLEELTTSVEEICP